MTRDTLLDFFNEFARKSDTFIIHHDGYRTRTYRYDEVAAYARVFAARLVREGFRKGDALVIWSENRPEWVVALWGTLLAGGLIVPVDNRASVDILRRIADKVAARALLVGDEVRPGDGPPYSGVPVLRLSEL